MIRSFEQILIGQLRYNRDRYISAAKGQNLNQRPVVELGVWYEEDTLKTPRPRSVGGR